MKRGRGKGVGEGDSESVSDVDEEIPTSLSRPCVERKGDDCALGADCAAPI